MTKSKHDRPIFYLNDNPENEIKAGGILFYKKTNNDLDLLMILNRGRYEDFGGRTDIIDKDYLDTVAREVEEESNKLFNKLNIRKRLKNQEPIYIKGSKYVLYFIELTESEQILTPENFGTKEIHDDIERTVEYINYNKLKDTTFIKQSLNFRLKNKLVFDKINSLIN
jgi:hypothetical protein